MISSDWMFLYFLLVGFVADCRLFVQNRRVQGTYWKVCEHQYYWNKQTPRTFWSLAKFRLQCVCFIVLPVRLNLLFRPVHCKWNLTPCLQTHSTQDVQGMESAVPWRITNIRRRGCITCSVYKRVLVWLTVFVNWLTGVLCLIYLWRSFLKVNKINESKAHAKV